MFAVTFHCMVEGDVHCQQHYMTDREEGVHSNSSPSDFSFVLFFVLIFSNLLPSTYLKIITFCAKL